MLGIQASCIGAISVELRESVVQEQDLPVIAPLAESQLVRIARLQAAVKTWIAAADSGQGRGKVFTFVDHVLHDWGEGGCDQAAVGPQHFDRVTA